MTVYSREDYSPINPSPYPTENKTAVLTIDMYANYDGSYLTTMYVGDSDMLQNTTQAAVDTLLQYTAIPASTCDGCSDAWYSESLCTGCLGPNVVPHERSKPEFSYTAKTYMMSDTCIVGSDSGSSDSYCVSALQVDLVDKVTVN